MRNILVLIFLFGLFGCLHSSSAFISGFRDIRKCSKRNGNFPKPGSLCRSYYKCKNWKPEEMTCPKDQHFFPAKGYCVWSDEYPCIEKPKSKECLLPDGKFLKAGTGCKMYYDCFKGVSTEKRCYAGLLFDYVREKCDWPEHVHCPEAASTTEKPSSPMTTAGIITRPTIDSEESSSDEDSSSEEDNKSSKEEDKSTSASLFSSSTSIDKKVSTDGTLASSAFPGRTYEMTFSTAAESSKLPSAASSIGESSGVPTTDSNIVESSEPPTIASSIGESSEVPTPDLNIKESSEVPTANSSIGELSKLLTTASIIGEYSKLPITSSSIRESSELPTTSSTKESSEFLITASSVKESSELPRIVSNIEEFTEVPLTASSVGELFELLKTASIIVESSELPTTASSITTASELPTLNIESSTESKTLSDIASPTIDDVILTVSEKDCDSTNDCINIKQSTYLTEINEELSSSEPEDASAGIISTATDSVTVNVYCAEPNGYFPHPNDKHKFIVCVGGDLIIMDCPSNLVYVHKKNICDYEKT